MKNVLSIFFVGIYLLGSMQTSWVLIDFYWNRDNYTQKYCMNLDARITQCRASCYLDNLLEEERKNDKNSQITLLKKLKFLEYSQNWLRITTPVEATHNTHATMFRNFYYFDFTDIIFHPPKS